MFFSLSESVPTKFLYSRHMPLIHITFAGLLQQFASYFKNKRWHVNHEAAIYELLKPENVNYKILPGIWQPPPPLNHL